MKANIPLNTVENSAFKQFLEKYTGKKTPSQSLLRKTFLPNLCEKSLISPILLFIENLDEHHSAASSKIHKLFENDLQTLKSELSNLSNVFQFLPIAITKLEARQLVVDADSFLNNVKLSLPNQVYREKWQQIVDKNPDLQVVVNSTLFASVPIVSVDVERFFGGMSPIMSPQRHLLSIE